MTVDELRGLFPNPATDHVDGIAWSMALTSMGAKEYWGEWEVRSDRVSIGGTKAKGRVRDVALLMVPVVRRIHRRTFEDKFRARTGGKRTVYDLRRSFAYILEAAGIVRTRRRTYMGHGAGDTTALYELHDVAAYLSEDARKLREFIAIPDDVQRVKLESGA